MQYSFNLLSLWPVKCNVKMSKLFTRKLAQSWTHTGGSGTVPHKNSKIASRANLFISMQHWPAPSHHLDCLLRSVLAQSSLCPTVSKVTDLSFLHYLLLAASDSPFCQCFAWAMIFSFFPDYSVLPVGQEVLLSSIDLKLSGKRDTLSLWNS